MTEDDIILLGDFCEQLVSDHRFQTVVEQFDKQCFDHFTGTDTKARMERESIYALWRGAKDFLDHVRAFIELRDQTYKRNTAIQQDAEHIEGID